MSKTKVDQRHDEAIKRMKINKLDWNRKMQSTKIAYFSIVRIFIYLQFAPFHLHFFVWARAYRLTNMFQQVCFCWIFRQNDLSIQFINLRKCQHFQLQSIDLECIILPYLAGDDKYTHYNIGKFTFKRMRSESNFSQIFWLSFVHLNNFISICTLHLTNKNCKSFSV